MGEKKPKGTKPFFPEGSPFDPFSIYRDAIPGLDYEQLFAKHPLIGPKLKRVLGLGLKVGVVALIQGADFTKEAIATARHTTPATPETTALATVDDMIQQGLQSLRDEQMRGPRE